MSNIQNALATGLINFNDYYLSNVEVTINPDGNTFLNAPTALTNTFTFTGTRAVDGNTYLQRVILASGSVIYAREYVQGSGWGLWVAPSGGGGGSINAVVSSTPELVNAVTSGSTVTISQVNHNQTLAPSNTFDYSKTDLYVSGNVNIDVSLMILNRIYNVMAVGGDVDITLINGLFSNDGTALVSIEQTNTLTMKKVNTTRVNLI